MSETKYPAQILEAIAQVRDEIGQVPTDSTHSFLHFDYASGAAIQRTLRPILEKTGLVILQSVATGPAPWVDDNGVTHLVLEYTLAHTSGAVWPEKLLIFASGNDRDKNGLHGDKGAFKANTAGYRYFLNRLFMIETGDDPGSGGAPPEPTAGPGDDPPPQDEGGGFASPEQLSMIMVKSYDRARELGQSDVYEDIDHQAGAIRKAAKQLLGLENAGKEIPVAAVAPMARAITATVLDRDGKAAIPQGVPF